MTSATATRLEALTAQVLQDNLKRALETIKPALGNRDALPITQHVHIATRRGRLALTATCLDFSIRSYISAKVENEGALTVPYAPLARMVQASPSATIALRGLPGAKLEMLCARAEVTFDGGYAPDDFPLIPEPDYSGPAIILDPKRLAEAIRYVLPAVAPDEDRPALARIVLDASPDGVTLTAADGYRLAHAAVPNAEVPPSCYGTHLLNPRALQAVMKLATRKGAYPDVALYSHAATTKTTYATFDLDGEIQVSGPTLNATYPAWRSIVPGDADPGTIVTFDRDALARDIKRASIIACDGSGIIRLTESAYGELAVEARAEQVGNFACTIDAEIVRQGDAPPFRWAGNMHYLLDMLASAGPTIRAHFRSSEEAAVFHSTPGAHLIMPMLGHWN